MFVICDQSFGRVNIIHFSRSKWTWSYAYNMDMYQAIYLSLSLSHKHTHTHTHTLSACVCTQYILMGFELQSFHLERKMLNNKKNRSSFVVLTCASSDLKWIVSIGSWIDLIYDVEYFKLTKIWCNALFNWKLIVWIPNIEAPNYCFVQYAIISCLFCEVLIDGKNLQFIWFS